MAELSARERLAWLRLTRSSKIGPVTFHQLLAHFGTADAAIAAAPELARRGGGTLNLCPQSRAEQELKALEKIGGRMIASCEPDYPRALKALEAPPPVITVLGHPVVLRREMIAMVGARNASVLGRKLAGMLAHDLGASGLTVVSGMARGIDAAAHEAALTTGTVAVLAGGVDQIYPPENAALYAAIREQGCLISEMPPGLTPQGRHFPRRNRIISGLARGVIVVEAAERSGSLITANYALEQNREIFAVPGSPLDPRAQGTNRLISEGATLTSCADDVLRTLGPILGTDFCDTAQNAPLSPPAPDISETEADRLRSALMASLSPAPVAVNELVRALHAPPGVLQTLLLEYELAGKILRHPGGKVSCL